jgi:hypothetical protein
LAVFSKQGKKNRLAKKAKEEYSIGQVSRLVNLSQKTIRDYEQMGLFKPKRHPRTNNRIYSDFEVEQIKRITYLIHNEGLTLTCLRLIIQMAPCWNIFNCSVKEKCPAMKNAPLPCYETRKKIETLCSGTCDQCVIHINRTSRRKKVLSGPSPSRQ